MHHLCESVMNEKYLLDLWGKSKHPHPKYGGQDMIWPAEFAELIIQECIAQCNDGDSAYFIASHFGIEEPKNSY